MFDSDAWVVTYQRRPKARQRLICFAHAGGGASAFGAWHRQLPESIEVCAVQLPGRDTRRKEPCELDMAALLERLSAALRPLEDRPFALFGYSLGALLAFEHARALRRTGRRAPELLMVAAARAPQVPFDSPIHTLPDAAFLREVETRYGGIPATIREVPELLAFFLPVIRADLQLRSSYRYQVDAPLQCPITAIGGSGDLRIREQDLDLWQTQTSGAFARQMFPGGHFFITTARDAALRLVANSMAKLERPFGLASPP